MSETAIVFQKLEENDEEIKVLNSLELYKNVFSKFVKKNNF